MPVAVGTFIGVAILGEVRRQRFRKHAAQTRAAGRQGFQHLEPACQVRQAASLVVQPAIT